MLSVSLRTLRALTAAGAVATLSAGAQAQFSDPCNVCATPVTVMANPCPCMQPVTTMEDRQVQVTAYRDEERTVKKPVIRTAYEDREVTAYRTVQETRTAEVPGVAYQQCTTCQQVTQNRSYWQTYYQPVPKLSPCQVDPRPGLLGEMNRLGYSMQMAFTPDYIPRRQYVPNVVAYNVPVTRTVAVPTTRTVAYNVAKLEPYTTTQRVARQVVEWQEQTVTVKVPYTETRTVQVPTTRWAMVDGFGGGSVSAARPTLRAQADPDGPARSAETDAPRRSEVPTEAKPLSYPRPKAPVEPRDQNVIQRHSVPADTNVSATTPAAGAVSVAGWRTSRQATPVAPITGPQLSIAAK